ncbi:hypothetical protein G4B88_029607 [Cannabis sativa]|uniref:Vacuolar-processing enzyme n=1 Tax=Cannabis sativa TaxID=3483 RepID=A0A7J6FZP2_CANSA|nr:hypothetical protein G4B88_029607 [Cannabis sativa]
MANGLSVMWVFLVLLVLVRNGKAAGRFDPWESKIRMPTEMAEETNQEDLEGEIGTRWAILVAGSSGIRHSFVETNIGLVDVCHAYQLLIKGGLKEENIVVFMYDDIAKSELNPRPGVIINHPQGDDVYAGVPKFIKVVKITMCQSQCSLINKWFMKIIHRESVCAMSTTRLSLMILIIVGMPNMPFLYGMDFIEVLKRKHAAGTYRKMVIYVEACESGSIFEGIMPKDMNIYVTTASNAQENSWGTYCPGMEPPPRPEYITCFGDLYSVDWMEDSQGHNLKRETIKQQYEMVKERTANANDFVNGGSHKYKSREALSLPKGFDPATVNFPPNNNKLHMAMEVVNQRDAAILLDLLMCT